MEVDNRIIKETQKSLGKHVKRPQLTDKLLQKPPFRFLHDIIKAVIKDTGFLAGLFTPDELDYEKIKDKDSKIAFLTKLISVVKLTSGKELTVRPSKIIAGLEAAKTNELLQAIGFCVEQKIDSTEAIQVVKDTASKEVKPKEKWVPKVRGSKINEVKDMTKEKVSTLPNKKVDEKTKRPGKPVAKELKRSDTKTKLLTKEPSIEKSPDPDSKTETESKTETDPKESVQEVKPSPTHDRKLERRKSSQEDIPQPETSPKHEPQSNRRKSVTNEGNLVEITTKNEDSSVPQTSNENSLQNNQDSLPPAAEPEKPNPVQTEDKLEQAQPEPAKRTDSGRQSRMSGRRQSLADTNNTDKREPSAQKPKFIKSSSEDKLVKLRPQSVRPPSARPGAPKRRDKNVEIILQPDEPVKPTAELNAKIESLDAEMDDNVDNLVIIEDPTVMDETFGVPGKTDDDMVNGTGEKEGHLVQQILETQREFSNAGAADTALAETTWESAFDSRHLTSAKNEALRDAIQKLTKSVNPLGKLLDFMQEDVDSMQIELTQQLELYKSALVDIDNEKALTAAAIQPFKQQLHQLHENIKFYQTAIVDVRCNILNNDQKIMKKLNEF